MNKYNKLEQKDDKYLVIFDRNRPKCKIYLMAQHLVRTTHVYIYIFVYIQMYIYVKYSKGFHGILHWRLEKRNP